MEGITKKEGAYHSSKALETVRVATRQPEFVVAVGIEADGAFGEGHKVLLGHTTEGSLTELGHDLEKNTTREKKENKLTLYWVMSSISLRLLYWWTVPLKVSLFGLAKPISQPPRRPLNTFSPFESRTHVITGRNLGVPMAISQLTTKLCLKGTTLQKINK